MAKAAEYGPFDKFYYRRIDRILSGLRPGLTGRALAAEVASGAFRQLVEPLGLSWIHVYEFKAGRLKRIEMVGAEAPDLSLEIAGRLPVGTSSRRTELSGLVKTTGGMVDIIPLNANSTLLLVLGLKTGKGWRAKVIEPGLNALRYALQQGLKHHNLEALFDEARSIQAGLLPPGNPKFGDYDIATVSIPADRVGGDVYDFMPLGNDTLAMMVADATGHGLPAALQARDLATGFRMGVARDYRNNRTVEKLNHIFCHRGPASRPASMFLGELELNGNFAFVNAGHPPPLLLVDSGFHELTIGGTLLGVAPDHPYKFGFNHLDRGGALCLFSDGVAELQSPAGEDFGTERIQAWMTHWRHGSARNAGVDLIKRLCRFRGEGVGFDDDVTMIFVRRPLRSAGTAG